MRLLSFANRTRRFTSPRRVLLLRHEPMIRLLGNSARYQIQAKRGAPPRRRVITPLFANTLPRVTQLRHGAQRRKDTTSHPLRDTTRSRVTRHSAPMARRRYPRRLSRDITTRLRTCRNAPILRLPGSTTPPQWHPRISPRRPRPVPRGDPVSGLVRAPPVDFRPIHKIRTTALAAGKSLALARSTGRAEPLF